MQSDWRDRLKQTIFGEFLSPSSIVELISISEFMELQPRQYLFREGQENRKVFVLFEGQLDLTMTVPGRGPTRILTLGPGELIAWSAVLGEGIMTSSAICIEPSQLIAVDCTSVLAMIKADSQFGYEFMRMMATALAKRLLATRLQMLDLFAPNT
jgi:CRP/FNR family transcriptional regulator, cyclic AMP receptor protein